MSAIKRVSLSCPEVQGLKCPFTGKSLKIIASICDGVVTYNAPDAFTLRKPVSSASELYRRASMRNGVYGVIPQAEVSLDPYSGEALTLTQTDDGKLFFDGGWDPTYPCLSLAECVYRLSCRKRILDTAPEARSVEHVGDMTPDDSDSAHKVVDDLTEEAAQKVADAIPGVNKGRTVTGYGGKRS